MSGKKIKYRILFFKCYKMWEFFNIDFENVIPCINLFLMYILMSAWYIDN